MRVGVVMPSRSRAAVTEWSRPSVSVAAAAALRVCPRAQAKTGLPPPRHSMHRSCGGAAARDIVRQPQWTVRAPASLSEHHDAAIECRCSYPVVIAGAQRWLRD